MQIKPILGLIICMTLCLLPATNGFTQAIEKPLAGHVVYGTMALSNDHTDAVDDDYDVLIFGADAQKPLAGKRVTAGFEIGALFSIDSDIRQVTASSGDEGGNVAVSVDVNSLMIDYFMGGFLSIEPVSWFRFYVGAGPLLIWSRWETETEASTTEADNTASDSGFGVGGYARAGADLFFTPKMGLTVGARINATTLSLDDKQGQVDVEGWQYYFGLAVRF
jgi:hypothetical protein